MSLTPQEIHRFQSAINEADRTGCHGFAQGLRDAMRNEAFPAYQPPRTIEPSADRDACFNGPKNNLEHLREFGGRFAANRHLGGRFDEA